MRNRPAQAGNRNFPVQLFEEREEFVNGGVAIPVHRERHSLFGRPSYYLVITILLRLRRPVVVVHVESDSLSDAVELQHVVAESHWQQTRQALVVIEFGALRLPV